jgi:septal ring factor EnvC (AmiA/AmiB activator)
MTPEEIAATIANTTNPVDGWRKVLADRIAAALAASEQRVDQAQLRGHQQSDQEWVAEYAKVRDERDDLRAKLNANCLQRDALQIQLQASERALERVREALKLLLADVQDYEPWQRPCHAVDVARAALASPGSPQEKG